MDNKLVSIALCTFNGELYLPEQLQSILDQTYTNIEIIICDDYSSDNTWSIIKSFQNKYPNKIKAFKNERNIGYNKNFERAISYCQGDYIAISDQDDIWLPDKVSSLLNILDSETTILAHCSSINFSNNKLKLHSDNRNWSYMFSGNDTRELIFKNLISGHNILFKKELVDKCLPIPEGIFYDWWIVTVATCYGNIVALPEPKVKRRIHGNNAFRSIKQKKVKKLERLSVFINHVSNLKLSPGTSTFINEARILIENKRKKYPGRFDKNLFFFLFKNRGLIFKYKKRSSVITKEWSSVKAAFSIASY